MLLKCPRIDNLLIVSKNITVITVNKNISIILKKLITTFIFLFRFRVLDKILNVDQIKSGYGFIYMIIS